MADPVIFIGERGKIMDLALQLAGILAGDRPDTMNLGQGFMLTIGTAALHDIYEAFLIKANGGTDEMGIKWPPLSPTTIARRRVEAKDRRDNPAIKEREKKRKQELAYWKREYKKIRDRLVMSMTEAQADKRAKRIAELRATKRTGRTKVDVLGNRVVEILRDTGVLLNSLGPGELVISGATVSYEKPSSEGGSYQIMEAKPGSVIVGTNVEYADYHQSKEPRKRLPRRQFLPDDDSQVPRRWFENMEDAAELALAESARMFFEQASGQP